MNQKDTLVAIGIQLERIADFMEVELRNKGLDHSVEFVNRKAEETTRKYLTEFD